ncbi:MAG: substrate-binding domain-containing protein [Lachnospiraceae bacterium]|nr:substrate-binding domain-containing protein [Lachnospiraceae bacterium]
MKKKLVIILTLLAATLTACSSNAAESGSSFNQSNDISVVSREDGSGTRGAFIELLGVEERDADGNKKDRTTLEAVIADKTAVMMTNVANDPYSIGYVSMGSLNDTVKALEIDGASATVENIKNGSYKVQRPFNIATKGEATGLAKDFIDFILSAEGQAVVGGKCIAIDNMPAYAGDKPSGKITVGGSSSVAPVMQDLIEAYRLINPDAEIVLDETDSSAGMNDAINGTCDIGMASRALKDSELEQLNEIMIAIDGIAVIANKSNPITGLTSGQVKDIYIGEITKWSGIK